MIVPYDPENHRRFVFSAWCHGAGEPFERLHRILRAGARCAVRVAPARPSLYMAYLITMGPQTIVWAYTKEKLRGRGLCRELLEHMGIDRTQPMTVLFRSPAVDELGKRGWPITYSEGQADRLVLADEQRRYA